MAELDYCPELSGSMSLAVRFSLIWTCTSALLVKKVSYEPGRDWKEFGLDVSKQALGAYWAWALSMPTSGCGDYWTSTLVETTLGVFVEYLALIFFTRLFSKASGNPQAFTTGEYHDVAGTLVPRSYCLQLVLWLLCVTVMKCVTIPVAMSYREGAEERVLKAVSWNQHVEMIFVVLITPCVMRSLQVWITDDFLKKEGEPGLLSELMLKALGKKRRKCTRGDGSPKKGKKGAGKKQKAGAEASPVGDYVPPPAPAPSPEQLEAGLSEPPAPAPAAAAAPEAEDVAEPEPAPPAAEPKVAAAPTLPLNPEVPVVQVIEAPAPLDEGASSPNVVQFRDEVSWVSGRPETPEPNEDPNRMRSTGSLQGRQAPGALGDTEDLQAGGEIKHCDSDMLPWAEEMTADKIQQYRADRGAPPASPEELAAIMENAKETAAANMKALRTVAEEKLEEALPAEAVARYKAERAAQLRGEQP